MSGLTFGSEPPPGEPGPELRALGDPDEEERTDPQSVLAAVRAEWAKEVIERTVDLELPGSRGMFVLRCGPIRGQTMSRLRQRLEQSHNQERETNLNIDVLIAATRGIYGRPAPGGELLLMEDADGPLTRIDERLGKAFGMEGATTARLIVKALFRHANVPDVAIGIAAAEYLQWASTAEGDVSEELLGES